MPKKRGNNEGVNDPQKWQPVSLVRLQGKPSGGGFERTDSIPYEATVLLDKCIPRLFVSTQAAFDKILLIQEASSHQLLSEQQNQNDLRSVITPFLAVRQRSSRCSLMKVAAEHRRYGAGRIPARTPGLVMFSLYRYCFNCLKYLEHKST